MRQLQRVNRMRWFTVLFLSLAIACGEGEKSNNDKAVVVEAIEPAQQEDRIAEPKKGIGTSEKNNNLLNEVSDTAFVNVKNYSSDFSFDMRYASENNFLKEKVYNCDNCLLRKVVFQSLLNANSQFQRDGYKIKFYDCFRPTEVQAKMWEILPDGKYVANPKYGSIHNRGAAVDITLVDSTGFAVDMGTDFDFFGEEAHHDYSNLDSAVLENRKYLKKVMEKNGFQSIRTEWWHYNFSGPKFPISNQELCNE